MEGFRLAVWTARLQLGVWAAHFLQLKRRLLASDLGEPVGLKLQADCLLLME